MALKRKDDSAEKVVRQIEEENYRTVNSMSTDEDGVVRDFPLLAGVDFEGEHLETVSFREMTGRDEEAINKGDVKSNSGKLVNVLLERVLVDIGGHTKKELGNKKWHDLILDMLGCDLDYILVQVRKLSKGNDLTFTHVCPDCKTKLNTTVDIDDLEVKPFNGNFETSFELPGRGYKDSKGNYHKTGVIRCMNGRDREIVVPLFRKNPSSGETMLITRLIKFDDGINVSSSNVADMSVRDREYLAEIIKENVFGIDTNIEVTCDTCGTEITGEIGTSDFF